ncbi:MAG: T9SS type A sorting domain-containing protein, partial [Bacteroidota bacterium]
YNDEAFWSESNATFSGLYYSKNMGDPILLTSRLKQLDDNQTSLEFLFLVSKGYVYWKQGLTSQYPDTVMCRRPDGTAAMIGTVNGNLRSCDASGGDLLFVTGNEGNATLQYSANGGAPVKVLDLASNRNRVAFLGADHFALQSATGIQVYTLKPAVELVKDIASPALSFKSIVNGGILLVGSCPNNSNCNFYALTEQADTVRLNAVEGSNIELYSINGENAAVITRASATTLATTIKYYKNGVAQANITNASSGFSASRVIATENMVLFEQSNYLKPDSTGMYVFDLNNSSTALNEPGIKTEAVLYPNPANDVVNISLEQGNCVLHVEIADLAGKVLYKGNQPELNIRELSPGFYLVNIKTGTGSTVKRILKQ